MAGRGCADLTIFALSSGRPPAAMAIVRISGPKAHDAARLLARLAPPRGGSAADVASIPRDGRVIDEALVLRFEDRKARPAKMSWNINAMAAGRWSMPCSARWPSMDGLREAEPGEFTRRALRQWPDRPDRGRRAGRSARGRDRSPAPRRAGAGERRRSSARSTQWQSRLVELSARGRGGDRLCR